MAGPREPHALGAASVQREVRKFGRSHQPAVVATILRMCDLFDQDNVERPVIKSCSRGQPQTGSIGWGFQTRLPAMPSLPTR